MTNFSIICARLKKNHMSTEKPQEVNLSPKMKIERQIIPVCLSVVYYVQEVIGTHLNCT